MRPTCGACKEKSTTCTYISLPGLTRSAALRSEVSRLSTRNGSLLELYWQLRHGSASEASSLLEQIRSGRLVPEHSQIPELRPSGVAFTSPSKPPYSDVPDVSLGIRGSLSGLAAGSSGGAASMSPTYTTAPGCPLLSSALQAKKELNPSCSDSTTHSSPLLPHRFSFDDASVLWTLQANVEKIREGFAIQRMCISEIFYCHNSEDFERLLADLEGSWNALLPRSMLCEVCALAATCGQYVRDAIPPGLIDYWCGEC